MGTALQRDAAVSVPLEFRLNNGDNLSIHIYSSGGWRSLYLDAPLSLDTWHHVAASLSSFDPDSDTLGLWSFDDYGNFTAEDHSPADISGDTQSCTWTPATYLP